MDGSTTVIRHGIETLLFTGQPHTQCDLCGTKGDGTIDFHLWDTVDVPSAWEDAWNHGDATVLALCKECDAEEIAKVKSLDDELSGSTASNTPRTPTFDSNGWTDSKGNFHPYGAKTQSVWAEKCKKSHYDRVNGPDGFGYLRPTSERGGKAIDLDADYALFFSSGWKDLAEPDISIHNFGSRPTIPDLGGEDRSNWPPFALLYWRDMGPPNPDIVRYAQWAAAEWKSGKNLQFGCFGGHGRTGTFLALLMVEAGVADGDTAIEWVRKNYCDAAIETKGQEDFIKNYRPGDDPETASW